MELAQDLCGCIALINHVLIEETLVIWDDTWWDATFDAVQRVGQSQLITLSEHQHQRYPEQKNPLNGSCILHCLLLGKHSPSSYWLGETHRMLNMYWWIEHTLFSCLTMFDFTGIILHFYKLIQLRGGRFSNSVRLPSSGLKHHLTAYTLTELMYLFG